MRKRANNKPISNKDASKKKQTSISLHNGNLFSVSKILQLTQENNDFDELVENLRNDIMVKNDRIFELQQQL